MEKEYQIIIKILKAFLYDKMEQTDDVVNWEKVMQLLRINSVSAIAGYAFDNLIGSEIPESVRNECGSDYFGFIAMTTMRDEAMKALKEQMDERGIDYLLFKGMIVKELYTIPELRTFGDIDFAIRERDRGRCHAMMLQLGYQPHDDWEPVYSYNKDYESYEIHTQLLDSNMNKKADYQEYFRDFWKHAVKTGAHSYELDTEYHLIFLLAHIAKHVYGSGAGIRMYLDIAFYLREYRERIDWTHFETEIQKINLTKLVNTVFSSVEKWFDVKSPIALIDLDKDFEDEFLRFTLNGGVFGFKGKAAKLSQVRKNSQGATVRRADTLLKRAFPSADTIKIRYTYLEKKPWLLPAAWVHRFFKKKSSTAHYLEESMSILKADKEEVAAINAFYDKIGI